MLLENIIRKHLLIEKKIRVLQQKLELNFNFEIIKSSHSFDRAMGIGRDEPGMDPTPIPNHEMLMVFDDFKKQIAEKIVEGEIIDDEPFKIEDSKYSIGIMVVPAKLSLIYWTISCITIMRETPTHKLRVGKNQLVLRRPPEVSERFNP